MKSIKSFKYVSKKCFSYFLKDYGYHLEDVKGFGVAGQKQYHGNILKEYSIHFNDGEYEYFKVATFKNFNEYKQASLGFNSNKLISWWENANVKAYKVCNEVISCW